jgi:transcriptional regulator CtsR
MSNYLEQAVKTASTRRSSQLAEDIVDTLLDGQVFTHPELDLAILKPALEKITAG